MDTVRKIALTIFVLFLFTSSHSQLPSDSQSLAKYSYLLVGIKSSQGRSLVYPIGTCFFARKNERIFLITAKHNITGINTFTLNKTQSEYDIIGVRYYNTKTKKTSYNSLNIIPIKKYFDTAYFFESPDACVLELNDTAVEPYLNSIEKYIFDTVIEKRKPDSVILYGYGVKEPFVFSESSGVTYYSGTLADTFHISPVYPVNNIIYYVSVPESIQGMSGSPVFFKYLFSEGFIKPIILFGGLMFGTNHDYKSAYVVTPQMIRAEINAYLR